MILSRGHTSPCLRVMCRCLDDRSREDRGTSSIPAFYEDQNLAPAENDGQPPRLSFKSPISSTSSKSQSMISEITPAATPASSWVGRAIERWAEIYFQLNPPGQAFYQAQDAAVRWISDGHEINEFDCSVLRLKLDGKDIRGFEVRTRSATIAGWTNTKRPSSRGIKEAAKNCRAVKVGQTAPVDRAVRRHEPARLHITNQSIIANWKSGAH